MIYRDDFFDTAILLVLFVVLAAAVAMDLRHHRIPNLLLLPALGFALMLQTIVGGVDGLIATVGGLTIGTAILFPLYALGGMGAGDVKLLGVVGSLLGPWVALVAGMATMMVGAVFGIAVICWQRVRPTILFHTSDFLRPTNGGFHSAISSHVLKDRESVTAIPYAPAIAVGTIAALWYTDFVPASFLS